MNEQETYRTTVNEVVDERTRFEMYYPPFEGAIEAGVGSIMCAYNKINSVWACENNSTLNQDLRDRLGFKGYVMSDWGATHNVSIKEGLDQE
jgi:beta-glucosidase